MSVPPAPAPLSPTPCPNCSVLRSADVPVCPNCGFVRPPASVWPPAPVGMAVSSLPPGSRLVTGQVWGDVMLGLGGSVLSCLLTLSLMSGYLSPLSGSLGYGPGLFVPPILYFALRRHYPVLTRGVGYGIIAGFILMPCLLLVGAVLVVLGIFATCSSKMNNS